MRFEKGHKTWNKGIRGVHFSPKTEFKKGMIGLRSGIHLSKKQKEKISNSKKGSIPWNKGKKEKIDNEFCLHCKTSFIPYKSSYKKYCSFSCYNKTRKKSVFKKCLACNKEFKVFNCWKDISKFCSRKCLAIFLKEKWKDEKYKEKQLKLMNDRLLVFPNKPEKIIELFLNKKKPNDWKYVGNGQVWFGGRNPDFININGQKKIIEVYGDYWHRGQNPQDKMDHYKRYGFKTLILWEHEIIKNNYENKLQKFIE